MPPECQFTQVVTFYGLPSSPGRDLLWLPAPLSGGSDVATLQDGLYKGLEAAQPKPETWRLLGRPKLQVCACPSTDRVWEEGGGI